MIPHIYSSIAGSGITLTITGYPATLSTTDVPGDIISAVVTGSASGGTPPYSYLWTQSTASVFSNPTNSNTTYFDTSIAINGHSRTSSATVKATDSIGNTGTFVIFLTFTASGGGQGPEGGF